MTAARQDEARETSGATTGLVLALRARARRRGRRGRGDRAAGPGAALVAELLRAVALVQLRHPHPAVRRRHRGARRPRHDVPRRRRGAATRAAARRSCSLVRAIGSPRQVFRQLPRAVAKFSHDVDDGDRRGRSRRRHHPLHAARAATCTPAWTATTSQGLLSMVPDDLRPAPRRRCCTTSASPTASPPASTTSPGTGAGRLVRRRRSDADGIDPELVALRSQLRILQSAATDLVASDDLETVLHRIVSRAAEAVLAPAYLLAVADPAGGAPLVHSAGLPDEHGRRSPRPRCSTGGDLGPHVVVVDVASARRGHGRLAAIYRPGDGAMGDERSMLAAYAGHAAAALDLIIALEGARLEADRAGALLALAHELAAADRRRRRSAGVVSRGAAAGGRLRRRRHPALGPRRRRRCGPARRRHGPRRRGAGAHADHGAAGRGPARARAACSPTGSPWILQRRHEQPGHAPAARGRRHPADVVAVPLLAGDTFLGVATAGWRRGEAPQPARRRRAGPAARRRRPGDHRAAEGPAARDRPPPGHPRRADRAAQPRRCSSSGSSRRSAGPPPGRTSPSCSATSTASRRSTTRSATPPATSCCGRSPPGCGAAVRPERHGRPAQRRRVRRHPARPGRPGRRRPASPRGSSRCFDDALPPGGAGRRPSAPASASPCRTPRLPGHGRAAPAPGRRGDVPRTSSAARSTQDAR